jgi:hypothetical protein
VADKANAAEPRRPASRVGPILALLAWAVASFLPGRFRFAGEWFPLTLTALILLPMVVRVTLPRSVAWARIERVTTLGGAVVATILSIAAVAALIIGILFRSDRQPALYLLASATALWILNVVTFAIIYWAMDAGGADRREARDGGYPDFMFSQAGAGDAVPPNWLPSFIDYLFLSFTTQTAFSPTDSLPLTSRAKGVMLLQSLISLVTLVVVASRAIGILQ